MPELALQLSKLEPETIEVVSEPISSEFDLGGLVMGLEEIEMSGVESVLLYAFCSCSCCRCVCGGCSCCCKGECGS